MNYGNNENERLKQLVDTFMSGYVGLFLASFSTGEIEFIKFKDGLLEHFGVSGSGLSERAFGVWTQYHKGVPQ